MSAAEIRVCERLYGGSIKDCACRLPNLAGWAECPDEARGILAPAPAPQPAPQPRTLTGDICDDCGSPNMTRAGTCLLCLNCGSTSGGCG